MGESRGWKIEGLQTGCSESFWIILNRKKSLLRISIYLIWKIVEMLPEKSRLWYVNQYKVFWVRVKVLNFYVLLFWKYITSFFFNPLLWPFWSWGLFETSEFNASFRILFIHFYKCSNFCSDVKDYICQHFKISFHGFESFRSVFVCDIFYSKLSS